MKIVRLISILILLILLSNCQSEPPNHPQPLKKDMEQYDWKTSVKEMNLSVQDIEKLRKNKILLTNISYRQVFVPYISTNQPFFITSDSLLYAYHILYEESFIEMEKAKSRKMPDILKFIWVNLETAEERIKGNPKIIREAKRRDQIIIGTALKLLGDKSIKPEKDIEFIINEEVRKITEAKAVMKPEWLGRPDPGFLAIDYSRYKPRGFYSNSEQMERYFRAVSWLQSIPFRINKDDELLSILMLGNCIAHHRFTDDEKQNEFIGFFDSYAVFAGKPDNPSITDAAEDGQYVDMDKAPFLKIKEKLLRKVTYMKNPSKIIDQISIENNMDVSYRILPSYGLPDSVLFQQLLKSQHNPSSLHVGAALGSEYAHSLILKREGKRIIEIIDKSKPEFSGDSLYCEYLDCLRSLVDEPDKDSPEFLKSESWKVKSCNTILAGWALARHTFVLQVKQNSTYICTSIMPPGFVEPDAQFFSKMADLSKRTGEMFEKAGNFEKKRNRETSEDLRKLAVIFEKIHYSGKGSRDIDYNGLLKDEKRILHKYFDETRCYYDDYHEISTPEDSGELVRKLRISADELERGKNLTYPKVLRGFKGNDTTLKMLWDRMESVSLKLEALSDKELRKVNFTEEEREFLKDYGKQIAGIMLYSGNSYFNPFDDSPKIVDVLYDTTKNEYLEAGISRPHTLLVLYPPGKNEYLEVGTSRPRALLVLYPYKGKEILCKGAVMPFYEFESKKRLNDEEWMKLLDSDKRPPIPEWMKPILGSEGIKKPEPVE